MSIFDFSKLLATQPYIFGNFNKLSAVVLFGVEETYFSLLTLIFAKHFDELFPTKTV